MQISTKAAFSNDFFLCRLLEKIYKQIEKMHYRWYFTVFLNQLKTRIFSLVYLTRALKKDLRHLSGFLLIKVKLLKFATY